MKRFLTPTIFILLIFTVVAFAGVTNLDSLTLSSNLIVAGDVTITGQLNASSAIKPALGVRVDQFHTYFNDFHFTTINETDHGFVLNANTNDFAALVGINGLIQATTAASDNDNSQIVVNVPVNAAKGGLVFEASIAIGTSIEAKCVFVGLTDVTTLEMPAEVATTTITTNASDLIGFVYDTDATTDQWYVVGCKNNTDATGSAITGVAPVANTYAIFRIEVAASGASANFYINGVLVGATTANTVTATTSLYPAINIESRDAVGVSNLKSDYIYCGHTR